MEPIFKPNPREKDYGYAIEDDEGKKKMRTLTDNQYHHLHDVEKVKLELLNEINSKLEKIIENGSKKNN